MATSVVQEPYSRTFDRPYAELVQGAGLGVTISVGAGRTIVIDGDPIDHVYRIVSGSVRLYKSVADGRRQIIDFLGPMDYFGLTGLDKHAYSVESITDVSMIRYPRKRLEAAIEDRPDLRDQLFRLACTELNRAQQYMLLLGRKSADERVASFLMDLVTRQGGDSGVGVHLHLAMSRQDIADHLGLTIETVSRIFTRLKQAGFISLPDRHAVIVGDVARLTSLAEGALDT